MLPRVVIYNAVSVDGRIKGFPVDMGLFYGLAARWREDVMLTGVETLTASPGLARDDDRAEPPAGGRRPRAGVALLAVTDSRGRLRCWDALRSAPYWWDAVALVSRSTPPSYIEYLKRRNVRHLVVGEDRVDLRAALQRLNRTYGAKVVRADCGGTLNGALLRAGLVDEVSVLVHPVLLGGTGEGSIFRAPELEGPDGTIKLRLRSVERLGGGIVWMRYMVVRPGPPRRARGRSRS